MASTGAVWLRRGGAALAAVLVIAAAVTVVGVLRSGLGDEKRNSRELAPGIAVVSLDLSASDVKVRSGSGDRVELTRVIRGSPEIEEEVEGDTIRITSRCPSLNLGRCDIDYEIVVPRDVRLDAVTSAGDITVDGVAEANVEATSGDVKVSKASEIVRASSKSGDITVSGGSAQLELGAKSGDVKATGVTSRQVSASAESGNIEVVCTQAPKNVRATTDSGNTSVQVPDGESYRVDAKTKSGDRTVRVPIDRSADRTITARASSGDVDVTSG